MMMTTGRAIESQGGVVIHTNRPGADRLSYVVTVIWPIRSESAQNSGARHTPSWVRLPHGLA